MSTYRIVEVKSSTGLTKFYVEKYVNCWLFGYWYRYMFHETSVKDAEIKIQRKIRNEMEDKAKKTTTVIKVVNSNKPSAKLIPLPTDPDRPLCRA